MTTEQNELKRFATIEEYYSYMSQCNMFAPPFDKLCAEAKVTWYSGFCKQLATAPSPVAQPVSDQDARHAIDGAIMNGKIGINPPPSQDHWLAEYWNIGRALAAASPVAQEERQQFEKWAADGHMNLKKWLGAGNRKDQYVEFAASIAWSAWQARAATPAQDKHAGSQQEAVDAARYRWLKENNFIRVGRPQIHTELHTWQPHSQTGEPTEWKQRVLGGALDAAIDAAMQDNNAKDAK